MSALTDAQCEGHTDGRHILDAFGSCYGYGCGFTDPSRDLITPKPKPTPLPHQQRVVDE